MAPVRKAGQLINPIACREGPAGGLAGGLAGGRAVGLSFNRVYPLVFGGPRRSYNRAGWCRASHSISIILHFARHASTSMLRDSAPSAHSAHSALLAAPHRRSHRRSWRSRCLCSARLALLGSARLGSARLSSARLGTARLDANSHPHPPLALPLLWVSKSPHTHTKPISSPFRRSRVSHSESPS